MQAWLIENAYVIMRFTFIIYSEYTSTSQQPVYELICL